METQCYWSLDPSREIHCASDEEYAEKFREIFTEAVRCRLRSASPIGAMLSGGLDSSSIVCVAQQLLVNNGENLRTFSHIFNEVTECDEQPFINAVLDTGDFKSHCIPGDQKGPIDDIDKVLWHTEEPFCVPGLRFNWDIYENTSKQGVRILLDGHGGDETVSHGYEYLDELRYCRKWLNFAREVRWLSKNGIIQASTLRILFFIWLKNMSKYKFFSFFVLRVWYKAVKSICSQPHVYSQFSWHMAVKENFSQRIGLLENYRIYIDHQPIQGMDASQGHCVSLNNGLQSLVLETQDKTAAGCKIEPRYPFWDKRLVEFCIALPPKQKLWRGWPRMILRRSMCNLLPAKIQWRIDKTNFAPRMVHGLRVYNKGEMEKLIGVGLISIEEYVNVGVVRKAIQNFMAGSFNIQDLPILLDIMIFASWFQQKRIINENIQTIDISSAKEVFNRELTSSKEMDMTLQRNGL